MKKFLLCFGAIIMAASYSFAQTLGLPNGVKMTDLPIVYLPEQVSVHFVSPEPIQYVDISSRSVVGNLPVKNVLRIKNVSDSIGRIVKGGSKEGVVTIVGEKFIAQYHVICLPAEQTGTVQTDIEILPANMRPLDFPGVGFSSVQLRQFAMNLFAARPEKNLEKTSANGISFNLNHVYTLGDYIFLDIGMRNKTNLRYDIDEMRFKIDDKKVVKASTVQSIEIKPELVLFDIGSFSKHYRNVLVFKKFTFPGNKVLHIEISEKQLSGRVISLPVSYGDILAADQLPLF